MTRMSYDRLNDIFKKLQTENKKLQEAYKNASEIIDRITSNEQCKSCKSKGMFPSSTCCDCVFDSICKLANLMDEKVVELT